MIHPLYKTDSVLCSPVKHSVELKYLLIRPIFSRNWTGKGQSWSSPFFGFNNSFLFI
jgi:hypothetical protein